MKVGFFHDSLLIRDSGKYFSRTLRGEIWLRYLNVFDEISVSTRVSVGSSEGMDSSEQEGVTFNPIDSYLNPGNFILNFPRVIKQIDAALENVDCAIIRLPSVIGWIASALAKKKGIPAVVELVGCPWDAYWNHGRAGKLMAPIGYLATRAVISRSTYVIYVTQEFLQKRYPTSGRSVGISNVNVTLSDEDLINRIAKIAQTTRERRDLERSRVTKNAILLGSIGKVDLKYKGHASVIRAISRLRETDENIHYEIVGAGDSRPLQNMVDELGLSGRVRFLGSKSRDQVDEWLETIDIYIQPSLTEGLPRSVVEAMAKAAPVILSNVGGHSELVQSEFLFPANDDGAISETLKNIRSWDLESIARVNFATAGKYRKDTLQAKRNKILSDFRESVERKLAL